MADYYKDLEKRIELQEKQIQEYCKEIEALENRLDNKKIIYKVEWVSENELTSTYSISETFEGACRSLLKGASYYKICKVSESLNNTNHTSYDILSLKYWNIVMEPLSEYINNYFSMVFITADKRGYVTGYKSKECHKIFCKVRKKMKEESK